MDEVSIARHFAAQAALNHGADRVYQIRQHLQHLLRADVGVLEVQRRMQAYGHRVVERRGVVGAFRLAQFCRDSGLVDVRRQPSVDWVDLHEQQHVDERFLGHVLRNQRFPRASRSIPT